MSLKVYAYIWNGDCVSARVRVIRKWSTSEQSCVINIFEKVYFAWIVSACYNWSCICPVRMNFSIPNWILCFTLQLMNKLPCVWKRPNLVVWIEFTYFASDWTTWRATSVTGSRTICKFSLVIMIFLISDLLLNLIPRMITFVVCPCCQRVKS